MYLDLVYIILKLLKKFKMVDGACSSCLILGVVYSSCSKNLRWLDRAYSSCLMSGVRARPSQPDFSAFSARSAIETLPMWCLVMCCSAFFLGDEYEWIPKFAGVLF